MAFTSGDKLSYYAITGPLGAGGMGEVYQARDTKLGRDVAIKVLPEDFANDPERLGRFQREAKVLASLNHSSIAAIYGLEESGGVHFLVLELVPGETLAQRIARGGLGVDEAIDIALQIAEALEEAHERGIVHRDLKPANVKITPDGKVKVLDFGLAKALVEESAEVDSSASPTLTRDATRAGVILGTAAYMSPEQARGKNVDKRSDIFSFGCVLYEMLTGRKAFDGEEVSDILAAILKTEPDFDALPPNLYPKLRELLRRCLVKDPKERRRDIGDVRQELRGARLAHGEPAATPISPPPGRASAWGSVARALFAAFLVGVVVWVFRTAPSAPVLRFSITLPEEQTLTTGVRDAVAVSPDGMRLAYVANNQIYIRSMDALDGTPVRGTENGVSPFFSPDGQWIGFHDGDQNLKKVSVDGGVPVTLCTSIAPSGARWEPDGTIVYAQLSSGIFRVSENGGQPEVLVASNPEDPKAYYTPEVLPGGRELLFTAGSPPQIVVQSLASGEQQVVIERGHVGSYLPTGHLMYIDDGNLFAIRFDPDRLEAKGGPIPVVESVATTLAQGITIPHVDVSSSGTLAYIPLGSLASTQRLEWLDRSGALRAPDVSIGRFISRASISPDGARLATARSTDSGQDIWLQDAVRGVWSRLTFEGDSYRPIWSADGETIVYTRDSVGLFSIPAAGGGSPKRLTRSRVTQHADAISPDGRWLLYHEHGASPLEDIWLVDLDGEDEPKMLFPSESREDNFEFSPDGRWVAYQSNESGTTEIYARPFSGEGKFQVTQGGGERPAWVGQEIIYRNGQSVMAVPVETAPFVVGLPRKLFEAKGVGSLAVSRDGERFVVIGSNPEGRVSQRINVVFNWFEELKRLAPVE